MNFLCTYVHPHEHTRVHTHAHTLIHMSMSIHMPSELCHAPKIVPKAAPRPMAMTMPNELCPVTKIASMAKPITILNKSPWEEYYLDGTYY